MKRSLCTFHHFIYTICSYHERSVISFQSKRIFTYFSHFEEEKFFPSHIYEKCFTHIEDTQFFFCPNDSHTYTKYTEVFKLGWGTWKFLNFILHSCCVLHVVWKIYKDLYTFIQRNEKRFFFRPHSKTVLARGDELLEFYGQQNLLLPFKEVFHKTIYGKIFRNGVVFYERNDINITATRNIG